ncbi:MAG: hypothetical protein NTZ83_03865 [Candidatus Pacearchaeota archaeon]|nr:hypothetical protein [Candidatus Pacearchaeota archaeon]
MKKLTTDYLIKLRLLTAIIGASFCFIAFIIWMFSTSNGLAISNKDPNNIQILFVLIFLLIGLVNILCAAICSYILEFRDLKKTIKSHNQNNL